MPILKCECLIYEFLKEEIIFLGRPDAFAAAVKHPQRMDYIHAGPGVIVAYAYIYLFQLIRAVEAELRHQSSLRLLRSIMGKHQIGEKPEKYRCGHNHRILLGIALG